MIVSYDEIIRYNVVDFLQNECTYEELKSVYGCDDELQELFLEDKYAYDIEDVEDYETKVEFTEALADKLWGRGSSDQEIIEAILEFRPEKYIVMYVPESGAQEDYFKILCLSKFKINKEQLDKLDKDIERIFEERNLDSDIGFDEEEEHFWKKKLVELNKKFEDLVK